MQVARDKCLWTDAIHIGATLGPTTLVGDGGRRDDANGTDRGGSMAAKLMGASVWEEGLYGHLTSHEEKERGLLVEYKAAADASESGAFRYLAALIIKDEIRHHRVFQDLASTLKTEAEMRPEEPAIPYFDHWGPDAAKVVELTDRLLAQEHADAKELHRLAAELKVVKDVSVWQLLVRLMEMDTDKHIEILNFVKRHARRAVK
jgi:hypothetical protein